MEDFKAMLPYLVIAFLAGLFLMKSCGKSLEFDAIQAERIAEQERIIEELTIANDSLDVANDSLITENVVLYGLMDSVNTVLSANDRSIVRLNNRINSLTDDDKERIVMSYNLDASPRENYEWAKRYFARRFGK